MIFEGSSPTDPPLAAGICVGPIKKPIVRKKSCYYYFDLLSMHRIFKTYFSFVYNYGISLHIYAETNHLPKYNIQVSACVVAQYTGDPLPPVRWSALTACTCISVQAENTACYRQSTVCKHI